MRKYYKGRMMRDIAQLTNNTRTALHYWKSVPNKNVTPGLSAWTDDATKKIGHTCNTVACFGGWLTVMPEFVALGVISGSMGEPQLVGYPKLRAWEVAENLFGKKGESLFESDGCCAYDDGTNMSAHATVTNRLKMHLKYLQSCT